MKPDAYPMHRAPRCTAKSKRTGFPCKSPAMNGWEVCRMHGAKGGAKPGKAHPNWVHGERSQSAALLRGLTNKITGECRDTIDSLDDSG
tara:strand:- start:119 stop:385 length:267 start_codon:yes stop_codon:yes gene_type:complete